MGTDATPLLAAIASNPDDDLPRLVYADWLDEHADPDRAEFIRLQCRTARVGPLDPTWAPAKLREYDLFKANEATWRTPMASDEGRMLMDRWRRGFPAAVMLNDVAEGRLTNGEWANGVYDWSASPNERYDPRPGGAVREVTFSGWRDGSSDLLWHPQLQAVRSLSLQEWYAGVGSDRVEAFASDLSLLPPGHFPELTTLGFGDGELTLAALETLADSAVLETVTHLSLTFPRRIVAHELADWESAVARLFAALALNLESLRFERPAPEVMAAFAAVEWPRLRTVHLRAASARDITALTDARLPQLEDLRLHPNLTDAGSVWIEESVDRLIRWPAIRGVKNLSVLGVYTIPFRRLLAQLDTPLLTSLAVFAGGANTSELSLADLTGREAFAGLKTLHASFTTADLAPLADLTVLPELHTIWVDDTEPLPVLRWRDGVRTVIPKDPPDSNQGRPHRRNWCNV